jgi:hypothetical protein
MPGESATVTAEIPKGRAAWFELAGWNVAEAKILT